MSKVGFIGHGSMGSMLLEGFLRSGGLRPEDAVVATRTASKLAGLRQRWPGVAVAASNTEAARARYLFLCVKPMDMKAVLEEILLYLLPGAHLVSIAGTVPIDAIERLTGRAVTKLVPSVTGEVGGGVSLLCHGASVLPEDAAYVEGLLGGVGAVKRLPERELALATELTSCMPGFIASIFQEMVDAAMPHAGTITYGEVRELVLQTLLGTARLLMEKDMWFDEAIARVATPGGITEEGVKVFRAGLPPVFEELFEKTMAKREAVACRVEEAFRAKEYEGEFHGE